MAVLPIDLKKSCKLVSQLKIAEEILQTVEVMQSSPTRPSPCHNCFSTLRHGRNPKEASIAQRIFRIAEPVSLESSADKRSLKWQSPWTQYETWTPSLLTRSSGWETNRKKEFQERKWKRHDPWWLQWKGSYPAVSQKPLWLDLSWVCDDAMASQCHVWSRWEGCRFDFMSWVLCFVEDHDYAGFPWKCTRFARGRGCWSNLLVERINGTMSVVWDRNDHDWLHYSMKVASQSLLPVGQKLTRILVSFLTANALHQSSTWTFYYKWLRLTGLLT